jgi:hypothetical protein
MDDADADADSDADEPLLELGLSLATPAERDSKPNPQKCGRPVRKWFKRHARMVCATTTTCGALCAIALLSLAFAAALDRHVDASLHWLVIFLLCAACLLCTWAAVSMPAMATWAYDRLAEDERAMRLLREMELARAVGRGFDIAQAAAANQSEDDDGDD